MCYCISTIEIELGCYSKRFEGTKVITLLNNHSYNNNNDRIEIVYSL